MVSDDGALSKVRGKMILVHKESTITGKCSMQTLGLMHLRLDHCPEPVVDEKQKKCYYPSKIWNTQDLAFSNYFEDGYEYELLIYFTSGTSRIWLFTTLDTPRGR
jgi:hypothetical protein